MKIQVNCPACSSGFVVDAATAGTQFMCPACAVPIVVPSGETLPPEPPAASAAAEESPQHDEAAPEVENTEVVCPRCQLHFSTTRHRAGGATLAARKRVLIVEDMGYFRKIAEEALADTYDVDTASNVSDAQSILGRGNVDLIVLDLTLDAQNDGLRVLREAMFKPCPVLIYTARDESEMYGEEWDELRRLGADDVLIKGIDVAESLQRKVGVLLGEIDTSHAE